MRQDLFSECTSPLPKIFIAFKDTIMIYRTQNIYLYLLNIFKILNWPATVISIISNAYELNCV
jgi:hypothetical protein